MDEHLLSTKTYHNSIHKRINRMFQVSGGLAVSAGLHATLVSSSPHESSWLATQAGLLLASAISLGYFTYQEQYNSHYEHDNDSYNRKADVRKEGAQTCAFLGLGLCALIVAGRSLLSVDIHQPSLSVVMGMMLVVNAHLMAKRNVQQLPLYATLREIHDEHAYNIEMRDEINAAHMFNSMNGESIPQTLSQDHKHAIRGFAAELKDSIHIPVNLIFKHSNLPNGLWDRGTNSNFNVLLFKYLEKKEGVWTVTVRNTPKTFTSSENLHIEAGIAILYLADKTNMSPDDIYMALSGEDIQLDDAEQKINMYKNCFGNLKDFKITAPSHYEEIDVIMD